MKKLTLTYCALFALFVAAPALFADDGTESYSGKKEVMQPAPPVCDFYRAHEWDLDIWAAFAFAADTGQRHFDTSRNANGGLVADPFFPDDDPFTTDIVTGFHGEQQIDNPNERINIGQVSKNQIFGRDNTWGGGADVKYFWNKYFGVGVEGLGLAAKKKFLGGGVATLTARYPIGRFAPYVTGGMGFVDGGATLYEFFNEKQTFGNVTAPLPNPVTLLPDTRSGFVTHEREFLTTDPINNNHLRALGQIGAGLEFRVTCHVGLMADFTWNFVFGQSDHPDKFTVVTENGFNVTTLNTGTGIILIDRTPVINQAVELRPGHSSDNQDFGLVRFGVTFSY